MKIRRVILIFLVLAIFGLFILGIGNYFYQKNKPLETPSKLPNNIKEYMELSYDKDYTYQFVGKYFVAYKYNKKNNRYEYLSHYECGNKCAIASYAHFKYEDLEIGRAVITSEDDFNSVLYDFNKGLLGRFDSIESLQDENNEYKYFVVKKGLNTRLITLDGKTLYNVEENELTDLSLWGDEGFDAYTYSLKNDVIMYKTKENKWGVLKLSDGKELVPAEYDYLRLLYYGKYAFNKDYIKIKKDNKWYLYNLESKKESSNGYSQILTVYNDVLVVQDGNNIYFKDVEGNNIINDSIPINSNFEDVTWNFKYVSKGVSFNLEDNSIYILVLNNDNSNYYDFEEGKIEEEGKLFTITDYLKEKRNKLIIYKYEIKDKKLTKLN